MPEDKMLVDPLAVFFRPALAGQTLLRLDRSHVEVALLPPLARVSVTRSFTNRSSSGIEAVMTLPAAMPHEVIHRLTVTIDGVACRATARANDAAERAHNQGIAEGRLAILHEVAAYGVQIISISGIAPGATVDVSIESVRPLGRPEAGVATLTILLGADPFRVNIGLGDAEALTTVTDPHPATLRLIAEDLTVTVHGSDAVLTPGQAVPIDCAAPLSLRIIPTAGRSLDRSAWQADAPGGWEAVRAPDGDVADVVRGRRDWIVGSAAIAGATVRVIAPSSMPGISGLPDNTRAMTAFAAANLIDAANPVIPHVLRQAANVLTLGTSIAYVGPEGELPEAVPLFRKVALPFTSFDSIASELPEPIAPPPPPDAGPEPAPPGPDLPRKDEYITPGVIGGGQPGRRRPIDWLAAAPVLLVLLAPMVALLGIHVWLLPLVIVLVGLLLFNAVRHWPRGPARRRIPWLAMLLLPPLASFIGGPFGLAGTDLDRAGRAQVIDFQLICLLAAPLLSLLLLMIMRGARRFTLDLGALVFLLTLLSTSMGIFMLSPEWW